MSLVVSEVEAGYGRNIVLHGVSLMVEAGTIVSLLGGNAADVGTVTNESKDTRHRHPNDSTTAVHAGVSGKQFLRGPVLARPFPPPRFPFGSIQTTTDSDASTLALAATEGRTSHDSFQL